MRVLQRTMRNRSGVAARWLTAASVGLIAACTSRDHPTLPGAQTPVSSTPFQIAPSAGAATSDQRVYISLPAWAIPSGSTADISVVRTGAVVSVVFVNGGFDPVAVSASAGDAIVIDVQTSGAPITFNLVAPARRPPVVVRTDPLPNVVDVMRTATLVVVFSQPIDGASLNPAAIQLAAGNVPVAGQLSFGDTAHLTVRFVPSAPLAGGTNYSLLVTQNVRDVNGDGPAESSSVPFATQAAVASPAHGTVFKSVTVGGVQSCGITTTGAAYCWGDNGAGQLGNGTSAGSATPTPVAGGLTFVQLTAGWVHTCGLTTNGTAYCWGFNFYGELGDGTTTQRSTPVPVAGGLTFRSLSAGDWTTCGLTANGKAYCWGNGYYGQVGVDSTTSTVNCQAGQPAVCTTPTAVAGALNFATLSAGEFVTCGVTTSRTAYCWGDNTYGELGVASATGPQGCAGDEYDGPPDPLVVYCSRVPAAVAGGLAFQDVRAMGSSACGITTSGGAYCWGANGVGGANSILGLGNADGPQHCPIGFDRSIMVSCSTAPVAIPGALVFAQIASGDAYSCALTAGAAAYCWGDNSQGELGNGSMQATGAPVRASGGLSFSTVSTAKAPYGGDAHTCGLVTTGTLYCWGANSSGQLGTGTTTNSNVPVKVAGQP